MEAVYFVVLFIFFVILLFMISQLKEEIRKQREQLRDIETLLKKNGVSIPKEEKTETRKVPEAKIYSPPSEEPVRAKPPAGLVSLKAEATPQEEKLEEKQPEVIEKSVSREPVFFKQEILEEKPETGSKALSKIKSWILYGQEEVPVGSVEYAVATTWLLRIGIIAIVSALVYVLNWSIERNLIGPSARLLIGLLSASAMLLGGIKLINKKYHLIAQGLLGGGIATFYFSTYAAGHFYQMIPVGLEFLFMALITVGAGVVSVYTNSMLVAIFGIIGGFFTPILLSTGNANLPTLYTYMLLLNIGILSIAHFKNWRLLNYLAFFFTYLLYAGGSHQNQKENFILNMVFLCIFFLIHSALAYYYKILKKEKSTTLEIIHLISNAFLFFILAYSHINHLYGSKYPSIVSNILGIYYIAHVYFFYKKNIEDKALSLSLLGLAVFFTGLTLPLFLEERALTFAWALFSAILLWLGKKLGSSFLSTLSYISYTILGFRTFFLDLPASFDTLPGNYWQGFIGRMLGTGSSILSYFLGLYLEHKQYGETIFDNKNDLHTLKKLEGRGKPILFWMGIIAFFLFLNAEFDAFFINSSVKELFITSTWCIFGFLIYFYFTATKNPLFSAIGILLLILVLFRFTVLFFSVWFGEGMGMYKGEYTFFEFILRWFTFFVIAFSIFNFRRFTSSDSKVRPSYFAVIGLLFLFQFLSLEVRQFFEHFMPRLQKGAVSVLWSVYAISCITYGIQKKEKALRYTGLALFLVVVLKVFFVDLARMDAIVRIFAFLILGGLLIFGSFLYIRSEKE